MNKKIGLLMIVLAVASVGGITLMKQREHADGGMRHAATAPEASESRQPPAASRPQVYTCPMHPEVRLDKAGQCPQCGMDLVATKRPPAQGGQLIAGRGAVELEAGPEKVIRIGTVKVQMRFLSLSKSIPAEGAYDPELYNAQQDYLAGRASGSGAGSAETRLKLLGMASQGIRDLRRAGEPDKRLLFGSHQGKALIFGRAMETDLPLVKEGLAVSASSDAHPGHVFQGRVVGKDKVVDPMTRTARIHAQVDDPNGLVAPGMYLALTVMTEEFEALALPDTCVLRTGKEDLVFVKAGENRFEPRLVKLGRSDGRYVEIQSGLSVGDEVVREGLFFIDSDSQLNAVAGSAFYSGHEAHGH